MIYFDNSSTTKPYPEAIKTYVTVSEKFFANPSSLHKLGGQVEQLLYEARQSIAKILNIESNEIIFTSGGTEANNIAIKGIAINHKNRGKHIITTEVEHASNYESFRQLEELGFNITYLPVDIDGRISAQQVKEAIRNDTILVSIIHVNNEIGTIQPIEEIGLLLKDYPKIFFHVDHVQGVTKVPLQYKRFHIDLCSFSSHKFHGPKGVGFLYKRSGVDLLPIQTGGSQEFNYRAGTENVPGIIAMAKALRIAMEKSKQKAKQMEEVRNYLEENLKEFNDIRINSPKNGKAPHIINFSVPNIKPEVLIHALEEKNIYVSTKSACSSKSNEVSRVIKALQIDEKYTNSAIRVSLSYENTLDEAKTFIELLNKIVQNLKEVMG